jgi:hypothetical protein
MHWPGQEEEKARDVTMLPPVIKAMRDQKTEDGNQRTDDSDQMTDDGSAVCRTVLSCSNHDAGGSS